MDKITGFYQKMKETIKEKGIKKDSLFIVLLAGVLLVVIALPVKDEKKTKENKEPAAVEEETKEETDYIEVLETRLKSALEKIDGAGAVEVMITLRASEAKIVEKDIPGESSRTTETDSEGGNREITQTQTSESTVYETQADGGSIPYVVKQMEPEIEGILIIASGGDNAVVKQNISEAVLALFHIEAHKIKVVKMNQ